ncbi:hypothetical protein FHS94_003744 [Sphingomonas aerophila]|uniref:Glycosyltransferase RgtA/B/C/D-like domain-containing protein n=2 Tax=Sphingomonas aerophila TaxID=1344948 RepID=A0A7W9EXI5_9SPHN|nr:hypothetical protein [Sphingomonas aerophila]
MLDRSGPMWQLFSILKGPARMNTSLNRRSSMLVLCLVALAAIVLLRWVALDSDVPTSIPDRSAATWADEGYKTLAARNLLMFGNEHWNSADRYSGWMKQSPVTQLSFLTAFKIGGQGIAQARWVAAVCFGLFLAGFMALLWKVYGPQLTLLGAMALSANYNLFIYSRLALFEIFIIVVLYVPLFALRRWQAPPGLAALVALGFAALAATFSIKASALLYFGPGLLGIGVAWVAGRQVAVSGKAALGLALGLVIALALASVTRHIWQSRLDVSAVGTVISALDNPLIVGGNVALSLAMLCAGDLLVFRRRALLNSSYSAALVGMVLLGPLIVGMFSYHPLRYWIPLLPVAILLPVEWLAIVRSPARPGYGERTPVALATTAIGGVAILIGVYWLIASAVRGWALPGLALSIDRKFLLLTALALAAAAWSRRHALMDGRVLGGLATFLMVLSVPLGLASVADLVLRPIRERNLVAQAMASELPHGASAAGDWAPELALGTAVPALYLGGSGNEVERVPVLKPDAFIHSGTSFDDATLAALKGRRDVGLSLPVDLGHYAGRSIRLYRLNYPR